MTTPGPSNAPPPTGRGRAGSTLLGVVLFAVYLANGREIGTYDTHPTSLLPLVILRGEGAHLDRFRPVLHEADGRLLPFVRQSRGHVVSRYPVGPALVALPLIAPQVALLDRLRPGWDRDPIRAWVESMRMAKRAAAAIAALVAVVLHRLLRELGLGRVALPATIAAALGSDLWVVASQALWQHGPASLALTTALLLLIRRDPSRLRFALAGLAAGVLVACRAMAIVFALTLLAHVAWRHPRGLVWFLPAPMVLGLALAAYNLHYFGALSGGQTELEAMHPELHGVPGPWSGDFVEGALGTLLSPSRGLLVYCSWAAVALVVAPAVARRIGSHPPLGWLLGGVLVYYVILARYAVWWGGFCFGPRYWTEVMPLLALLLAFGLDWARTRSRAVVLLFAMTIAASVALQAIGAFCYPSNWCLTPSNIDLHHERLWDWSDSEVSRCVTEALLHPKRFESF